VRWSLYGVLGYRVWDDETLSCLRVLEGHCSQVSTLAVAHNYLVSGSEGTVRVWDSKDLAGIDILDNRSEYPINFMCTNLFFKFTPVA
jgi:WD40 repeat protein